MPRTYTDKFGILVQQQPIAFGGGLVEPLSDYQATLAWFKASGATDAYLYPPIATTMAVRSGRVVKRVVARSSHNEELQQLPATHRLQLYNSRAGVERGRGGRAGLIMHFLGFLYGYRCHFRDWWIDGRVSRTSYIDHRPPSGIEAGVCIDAALARWRTWGAGVRRAMLNTLYLHPRAATFTFEWDRFAAEYQVFDALFAISKEERRFRRVSHAGRFGALCRRYRIPSNRRYVSQMVRLRNEFVHEGLWEGSLLGDPTSFEGFWASRRLHNLTRRITLSILGLKGKYVSSPWWGTGGSIWQIEAR